MPPHVQHAILPRSLVRFLAAAGFVAFVTELVADLIDWHSMAGTRNGQDFDSGGNLRHETPGRDAGIPADPSAASPAKIVYHPIPLPKIRLPLPSVTEREGDTQLCQRDFSEQSDVAERGALGKYL